MHRSMAIESPCPGCGVVLAVPDEHAGKQARCPECSALFVVPKKSVSAPPATENRRQSENPQSTSAESPPPEVFPSESARNESLLVKSPAIESPPSEPEFPLAVAPPPDHRQWWLKTPQGAVYGPISKEQLDVWCEEGRIADDCHVKHEEEHAWRTAVEEYPVIDQEEVQAAPFALAEGPPGLVSDASFVNAPPSRPTVILPHRAVIIFALGAASWITAFCPVFGVIAWNMGNRDLELMYAGQMDASGMRMTHAGRLLGLIHVLTFVTLLILGLGFAVIYLVMQ